MDKIELPEDWKDFCIVETVNGAFTGQVKVEKDYPEWNEKERIILRDYTKQYLEEKLGYEVKPNLFLADSTRK